MNITKELVKCKLDPIYFINNYIFIEIPGTTEKFKPYQAQFDLLENILKYHYVCVLKSRQIGISTIIQAFCVYLITFYSNISVGIISRDGPESTDFSRKCRIMFESLPEWMRPKYIKRTEQTFELDNNSRIIANPVNQSNPQSIFRGKTITFLVIDEAAFIRKIEEAFTGISPSVTTAHRVAEKNGIPYGIVILSTPNGTTGIGEWFYKMYLNAQSEDSAFKPMRIHYSQAPFADERWLESQKKLLLASKGPEAIEQELELKFIASSSAFFERETFNSIQMILEHSQEPVHKESKVYFNKQGQQIGKGEWLYFENLSPDNFYILGVDIAPAYGNCNSAIEVVDSDLNQVAEFAGKLRIMDLEEEIKNFVSKYPNCYVIVEANSYGSEMVERLSEDDLVSDRMYYRKKYDNKGRIKEVHPGLLTDSNTRPKMMQALYWKITENPHIVKSKYLAKELLTLEKSTRSNRLTDRLMSLAFILYVKEYEPQEIPDVHHTFQTEDNELVSKILKTPKTLAEEYIQKEYEKYSPDEVILDPDTPIWNPANMIKQI